MLTRHFEVRAVCSGLSVQIFEVIMVFLQEQSDKDGWNDRSIRLNILLH